MPAITIGQADLIFGVATEGIGIIQSFSETRNVEKSEIRGRTGDVVGIAYYNATTGYSLSVAVTGTYSVTAGAALSALSNAVTSSGTIRIDSITINKSNDAFVTLDISATGYPNVTT
jgi:hypothetical protein